MERVPVPVLHHVCACGEMRINDQPQLPGILRILRSRIPSDGLSISLCNKEIRMLQRTPKVVGQPNTTTTQPCLRLEIDVLRDYVEIARNRPLVEVGMNSATEILSDELVGTLVFINDFGLPPQILGDHIVLESFPLQLVTRI